MSVGNGKGYIKLYRQIEDNPYWLQEPFTRAQAWIDMILLANHKPGWIRVRGVPIMVDRGQLGWSEVALSKRWKWSRGKCRRFLEELSSKTVQQIEQQKTNVTTLITILNYDHYQGNDTADRPPDGQQTDSKRYTNKNVKNVKNKTNSSFEVFWNAYPKKKSKAHAMKAWNKIKPDEQLLATILEAIKKAMATPGWTKENGQFIPYPATWLNAMGWEDEIEKVDDPVSPAFKLLRREDD